MIALIVVSGACGNGAVNSLAAGNDDVAEATVMMGSYEQQQKAAAASRAKDPAWKPACDEVGKIQVGDSKRPGALRNFCLNAEGNILACFAGNDKKSPSGLRVYSPKGELLQTLPLDIKPSAVCVAKDGSIFVAGDGKVFKLDTTGKVLASADSPVANIPVVITEEIEKMLKESRRDTGRTLEQEKELMKNSLEKRRSDVTGIAVTEQDVFMAVPTPNAFTYQVYRFDHSLGNAKVVVEKLRGCCSQMDIQTFGGNLWIPHNARHRVESLDRDGKELTNFGKAGKVKAADFGGCCEPKNLRVLPNGDILAAESGPPTCIKRFSAAGKFIEVLAMTKEDGDCVRVTVEASPDGKQFYMLDTKHDAIRIFAAKS
ncbi:MAG: hypothetical protein QM813_22040 [Verrucomicrobiota bacterium]